MRVIARCAFAALVCAAFGCAAEPSSEYVALEVDFADFRSWDRRVVDDVDGVPESIYGNELALGGPPYPEGAILVKTEEIGPPEAWRVHALVKRGGDFAADEMRGWELFELYLDEHETPRVLWRGARVPEGAGYGDPSTSQCIDCHSDPERDYTLAPAR